MNYENFNRKYVPCGFAGSNDVETLWEHKNGTVCSIDMYWEDNYVFMSFQNGITFDIALKGSVIKVGFHDDVRTRDLSYHPSWKSDNRVLLVKLWLRHILGQKTTHEQREAMWDVVSNEFNFN